jgi:hypothetical protein
MVGRVRIDETIDPELTIDRALETYLRKGYIREWINQRLSAIQVRKELTDEWQDRSVKKGMEYAILTDEITRAWSGLSTRQYKNLKKLKKEVAIEGGSVAGDARRDIEKRSGRPVITEKNAVDFTKILDAVLDDGYENDDEKKT